MPLADAIKALFGALRLARFDADGMQFFDQTATGFWRSFFAAVVVSPLYLGLVLVRYEIVGYTETPMARYLAVEVMAYIIAWVAFPVIMDKVAQIIDRDRYYIRFIIAYNWSSVLQNAVYLPIILFGTIGVMTADSANGIAFIALIWVLVYSWFVTRIALDVPAPLAAGLVLMDLALSVLINSLADSMI